MVAIAKKTAYSEEMLSNLYRQTFPAVASLVHKNNGSLEEAQDIFQDALVLFIEHKDNGSIDQPANYLYGIARNLWNRELAKKSNNETLDSALSVEDEKIKEISTEKIQSFLLSAGQKCLNLLSTFYYEGLSLSEIAHEFGFSGTRSATVQKYKCIEKLRTSIKQKELSHESFID